MPKTTKVEENVDRSTVDHWLYGCDPHNKPESDLHRVLDVEFTFECDQSITDCAKTQLVHALLLTEFAHMQTDVFPMTKDARVERVMEAIQARETQAVYSESSNDQIFHNAVWFRQSRWTTLFGMAASLLLCIISVSFLLATSSDALATIDRVVERITLARDRHYFISVDIVEDRDDKIQESSHKTFVEGHLYLRDNNQFVLIQKNNKGQKIIKGTDGLSSWQIGAKGELRVEEDPYKIKLPLALKSSGLILMDVEGSLTALKDGYDLNVFENQSVLGIDNPVSVIQAVKQSEAQKGVKEVWVYFNAETYVIERMVFDRVHLQGSSELKRVTLDLIDLFVLPDLWFNYQGHE